MANDKPKLKKRDLYIIDKSGRQTDAGLHDIDGKDDKDFRDIINQSYRTYSKPIPKS